MMEEIKVLLRYAFQTGNALTFAVSGPGSVGMETCFVNLVEPGDKVIVCRNGVFGGRMIENVQRFGGTAAVVEDTWGEPVDPQKVADALKANPDAQAVAFVHAETSTGVRNPAKEIGRLIKDSGALFGLDCVTSLGGIPVEADEWGADIVYSVTQKCLSCPPGLSPVTFSEKAMAKIAARREKVPNWYLDIGLLTSYWSGNKRAYHHTAPVNMLYALYQALCLLEEEGLEQSFARHARCHKYLVEGLEKLGLKMFVSEQYRLPMLNLVTVPEGVDEAGLRARLLNEFGIEIGAGLGPLAGKVVRIGLMGHTAREENVERLLKALEICMNT
jgi:alanine-glyoxylate transaminase/serine-glyoxylate transaminase/serine-pyruvate transaminase